MTAPRLLVVADHDYARGTERWLAIIRNVAENARGLPVAIQVRAKQASAGELATLAAAAREAVPPGVPLYLNGPASLAVEHGFDGVHWPEADIPDATHGLPPTTLRRSAAVHSIDALQRAQRAGVDFVIFGSVFEPGSKSGAAAGLDALRDITRAATVPVLAIGGITPERVAACLEAGAAGVAVVSGILDAASPGEALDRYRAKWTDQEATAGGRP